MALLFIYFISSIQIFNTLSKTIMSLSRELVDEIIIQKNIFMVTCTYVRGSTLARLATVLVLLSIGNTPALRVITLRGKNSCSTSYYSSGEEFPALRVITFQAGRSLLCELRQRAVNRQPGSRSDNS